MSPDGGKQVNFSGAALPIIRKHVEEWEELNVMQEVIVPPQCVSPLLLIPNEGKTCYRLCHDLRMLDSVTERARGPVMDRLMRLIGVPEGSVFRNLI